jgi:AcrR family transcriptional regulator
VSKTVESKPRRGAGRPLAKRREEILDAATELFAVHGYSGVDTQQLAERLQVGKGTLYRCFPSKKELFLAAVDRVMRRLQVQLEASLKKVDDPLEGVVEAARTFLGFFAEHPRYVELLVQERALFKDRKTATYYEHRLRNVERWRELYRSLIAEGRVRDISVERITDVISDLLYGTIFTNYFAGRSKPADEQARDVFDIVFSGILSGAERARRGWPCGTASAAPPPTPPGG